jgi:hypothetical protein
MDDSENLVRAHLQHLGFKQIVYQPDGNIPPDFLVDHRIAVEVRRLNQNYITASGQLEGLETIRIATQRKLQRLLHSLGPSRSGVSWFVTCHIKRPVPRWKDIEPRLRRRLENFRDNETEQRFCEMKIAPGLQIAIVHKASKPHPTYFVSGGGSDNDTGGFVFEEIQRNLRLCVENKSRRIAPVRHRYPEWWLVFVDRIGFGVADCDESFFREHLEVEHDFQRVILLDPFDATRAFEVPATTAESDQMNPQL